MSVTSTNQKNSPMSSSQCNCLYGTTQVMIQVRSPVQEHNHHRDAFETTFLPINSKPGYAKSPLVKFLIFQRPYKILAHASWRSRTMRFMPTLLQVTWRSTWFLFCPCPWKPPDRVDNLWSVKWILRRPDWKKTIEPLSTGLACTFFWYRWL